MDRFTIISAFTPIAVRRWSGSWRCRSRSSNNVRSSSSCAHWKPGCGSMRRSSLRCRSASTPPRTSKPRGASSPIDSPLLQSVTNSMAKKKISFQGEPGANSHLACREAYPDFEPMPCATFEDAFAAVASGEAALAMIPIENSVAGRVADIHHLMPRSGLHIVAEWFLPVKHQLVAPKGSTLEGIKTVESHVHALGQCRNIIRKLKIKAIVAADTAGSARGVSEAGDKTRAPTATKLAGGIYGLDILARNIEEESHNTTGFLRLPKEAPPPPD